MNQFSIKWKTFFTVLLVIDVIATCVVLTIVINDKVNSANYTDQYILYIGLNDKDTNEQELTMDECKANIEEVCLQYVSGLTITEANGVWTDDDGNIIKENTVICCINDADEDAVNAIADQLLTDLNQSSILIEHNNINYEYYSQINTE